MVWRLIFKSFIHLEFIFVYGVSWSLSFIFLHVTVQISQQHLLKRLFLLHFMHGASFDMLTCHLNIFFGEVFINILGPFFNWLVFLMLSFKNSLYILDSSLLSDVSLVNVFSKYLDFLLILLKLSFAKCKFLILIKPSFLIAFKKTSAFNI